VSTSPPILKTRDDATMECAMSDISSLGGSSSYALAVQQLQQQLFQQVDTNGSGSVTKTQLEQAVSKAGGSTAGADALYAQLDPNNTGSVSEQQFAQNLPLPHFSPEMGAQLISDQAQMSGTGSNPASGTGSDPEAQFAQNLFSQLTNGSSTLTQSELEQAVTKAGGTTQAADALYAKLDPNNTGSVSEQQFAQNLPAAHAHHHHGGGGVDPTAATDGDSADDALFALLTPTSGTATTASSSDTGSDASGDSAEDALLALLSPTSSSASGSSSTDPLMALFDSTTSTSSTGSSTTDSLMALFDPANATSSSASASASGNTAEDALLALLDPTNSASSSASATAATTAASSNGSTSATASTPASLFSNFNQQILSLMLQMQQQTQSLMA
jgi:Ca2+-binding EF-hand superfamily protein